MPIGYLRILDREASQFSVPRKSFLAMLLHGMCRGEGSPSRSYDLTEPELITYVTWAWKISPANRPLIAARCRETGFATPGDWIVHALNHWIGHPDGLKPVSVLRRLLNSPRFDVRFDGKIPVPPQFSRSQFVTLNANALKVLESFGL